MYQGGQVFSEEQNFSGEQKQQNLSRFNKLLISLGGLGQGLNDEELVDGYPIGSHYQAQLDKVQKFNDDQIEPNLQKIEEIVQGVRDSIAKNIVSEEESQGFLPTEFSKCLDGFEPQV